MKRREFLASSLAASVAASAPLSALTAGQEGSDPPAPEYYELRLYHLRRGPQQKGMDAFLREAALPAAKRIGIGPVGVFNVMMGPDSPTLYVLIPYASLESFATAGARLAADAEFAKAGASFLNAAPTDPAYVRVESSLMVAFDAVPKLEMPPATREHRPRIFELRAYESHSKKANKKKIEMFNQGEIAIFRRIGLQPVFFGETLIGARLPSLTYMVAFDDLASREKSWAAFIADPEWKKLSTMPGYADGEIVSNISNVLLSPTPYSEI
jgi:hypothetical protein